MQDYPETHQTGRLELTNPSLLDDLGRDVDFGIQIAADGRVWICVDGIALLRFKPERKGLAKA